MFIDELIEKIKQKRSNVVVGLDPRIESIPSMIKEKYFQEYGKNLKAVSLAILEFNKTIIDHVYDLVPAVKPQIAFYEQYGIEGLDTYIKTCDYAKEKGLLVIGDIKRGDIGTTSKAYSNAHIGDIDIEGEKFKTFQVDAITVSPYLGGDSMDEFMGDIKEKGKGMFVLVKTSNKGSGQLQDLEVEGRKIYEVVANMVEDFSQETLGSYGYGQVGAVVAATFPEQAKKLRKIMKTSYLLVPGYGAQGGTAKDIIDCFNEDGLGAIINSSRGIIFAYKKDGYREENYGEAARCETIKMMNDINHTLEENNKKFW
ncbi:orotidine-5'-phosphate decarboxylase [Inediibacterium massiliense]|uniref:orotidine-5'-phosphate decarboxylase n=1 Tax=Inediibacterium massiliense TaxID=1658111 RepID=UPI0006B41FDF|nr:orotidine-5'-phosphate decarboxylase [Inediibacterium massiliense]